MLKQVTRIVKGVARRSLSWISSPRVVIALFETYFHARGFRRKQIFAPLSEIESILVVRLDEIGDAVMTTALLRELRRNTPNAWITLVVNPTNLNLFEICPFVNEVFAYNWNSPGRYQHVRRQRRAISLAKQHLWKRKFDLALLPRWDYDEYNATFLAYLSGARRRIGYSDDVAPHKSARKSNFNALLTDCLNDSEIKHEVERDLALLTAIGGTIQDTSLEIRPTEEDRMYARRFLSESAKKRGGPLIGIGPSGGSSWLKQWPIGCFTELCERLTERYDASFVIVGGPHDVDIADTLKDALGDSVINAIGRTTLRQTAALLSECVLYIGNDSGPMHLAAACDVAAIALFGSSCQHRFRPWGAKHTTLWHELPCSPCHQPMHSDKCHTCIFEEPRCMHLITVDEAFDAVSAALLEIRRNEVSR